MGNLTQLTYPSGRKVGYTTSANELNKVTDTTSTSFDYVTGASYSPLGALQQLNLANQVTTTLGWNNLARLTSILTQKAGNPALLNFAYTYFANGQIQQITNNLDSLKTEKYSYDELGRLLTAQRGPDTNIQRKYSYDYDRFANRWGQNLIAGSGLAGSNTFDYASNRVTSPNFSFDASGNITANGAGTSYTFNPENFMATAGASTTYSVDTLGRRAKKTVSGVTTNYFHSGSAVISELQGSTWTDYIFFADQRIAQQSGSSLTTAKFLHQDQLGSTRVCTDGSGNSAGSCDYEPFGEFQPGSSCSALPTNYRFAGMEYDPETGLYHTWFRQYDPNQGRWMGVDPLPGSSGDPQSLDRYAYVLDDPADLVDPTGLCVWVQLQDPTTERPGGVVELFCFGGGGQPVGDERLRREPREPSGGPKPQPCVKPTGFQRLGITAQGWLAKLLNKTIGLGAGLSASGGNVIGVNFTLSRQLVVSPNGQAAYVNTFNSAGQLPFNAVVTKGAGGYGGIQFSVSNARNPQDLGGISLTTVQEGAKAGAEAATLQSEPEPRGSSSGKQQAQPEAVSVQLATV